MNDDDKVNVLLVDDNEANLTTYESVLEDLPVNLIKARSGKEALRHAFNTSFAAILMDVRMPEMDGFEAARTIRSRKKSQDTPLLFITANFPDQPNVFKGYSLGAVDYLTKPLVPEILRAKVAVFAELHRKKQELARAYTEMQKARDAADAANRHKSQFLTTMSHELRTPLNAILGFTGLLLLRLPGPLNENQEQQLQTIKASAHHLLSLINDALDLAKVEAGKMDLRPEPLLCQSLVAEVLQSLRPLADGKGLKLECEFPEEQLVLKTDHRAVMQVLLNLGNNAIKFTERGEVRIDLRRQCMAGKAAVVFSVIDTGIGIRPEDQPCLFQAFEQVNGRNESNPQGSGLGLHLSRELAGLLGGQITLESEYGRGSTFALILPEDPASPLEPGLLESGHHSCAVMNRPV